jgi:outer membrane protein OmpA-like peptidoglycan-associated protein
MTTRILLSILLAVVAVSGGLAQTTGPEKLTLLQDRGLQFGVQIGGFIGDNEQPKEMRIIRLDNLTVQLFETFSPRLFLDYGLFDHVRGQVGAGFGKIVGRYYSTNLIPIDYRFMVIPCYAKGFSPYAYLGIGALHYDVSVSTGRMSPGVATTGWTGFMPGGIGFVSELSNRLALDFNLGYSFIFSDDVNGRRGGNSGADSYYAGHFGIRIPLASRTAAASQEEELNAHKAAMDEQRRQAEAQRAAEEQRRREVEEKRLKEENARKAAEAQKALEAQKPPEVKPPVEPPPPKVEQAPVAKAEISFATVYFKVGGSTLVASERAKLDAAAKTLKEHPHVNVIVSGHTDNTGSRLINEKLSQARADAVRSYLSEKGISGERLTAKGFAFDKPAASNDTVEGRRLNRRTELDVVK